MFLPLILADTVERSGGPPAARRDPRDATAAASANQLNLMPPRYTRQRMESALHSGARWMVVYGTRDPAATPLLHDRARLIAQRLMGDSSLVRSDREVSA